VNTWRSAGNSWFGNDYNPPPLPVDALPSAIPGTAHRVSLNLSLQSDASPSAPAAKRAAIKTPSKVRQGGAHIPAGLGTSVFALLSSPRTPVKAKRTVPVLPTTTDMGPLPPIRCEAALDAIIKMRPAHESKQLLLSCNEAESFYKNIADLLTAAQQICESSLCSSHPLSITSNGNDAVQKKGNNFQRAHHAEMQAPSIAQQLASRSLNTELPSCTPREIIDSRLLMGLTRELLSNDLQLALLLITRVVGLVAQQARPSCSNSQNTKDQQLCGAGSRHLCMLLQTACDAIQVTMRYILQCKPICIPDLPDSLSGNAGLEWIATARSTLDQIFAQPQSSPEKNCTMLEPERAVQCEQQMSTVARLLKLLSPCMTMQGDLQTLWCNSAYSLLWGELSNLRAEAPPQLFQGFFSALDLEGLPSLHSAVQADDIDIVELLLLLGASPLARVPLTDGTEVPWFQGIAGRPGQAGFELLSKAQQAVLFSEMKPRAAAWQPTLIPDMVNNTICSTEAGAERLSKDCEIPNKLADDDDETITAKVQCWFQTLAAMGPDGQMEAPPIVAQTPDLRLGTITMQLPFSEHPEDVKWESFTEVCPKMCCMGAPCRCMHCRQQITSLEC
jgi:hypothetical protein